MIYAIIWMVVWMIWNALWKRIWFGLLYRAIIRCIGQYRYKKRCIYVAKIHRLWEENDRGNDDYMLEIAFFI